MKKPTAKPTLQPRACTRAVIASSSSKLALAAPGVCQVQGQGSEAAREGQGVFKTGQQVAWLHFCSGPQGDFVVRKAELELKYSSLYLRNPPQPEFPHSLKE